MGIFLIEFCHDNQIYFLDIGQNIESSFFSIIDDIFVS